MTGVQTCALPILPALAFDRPIWSAVAPMTARLACACVALLAAIALAGAQTTAGAPFNNPSFSTQFDANNGLVTLTFANPVSCVPPPPLCAC